MIGFLFVLVVLAVAFGIGYWYRGWEHNLDLQDGDGEYLGG